MSDTSIFKEILKHNHATVHTQMYTSLRDATAVEVSGAKLTREMRGMTVHTERYGLRFRILQVGRVWTKIVEDVHLCLKKALNY